MLFLSEFLLVVIDHDFEKGSDSAELGWWKLIEQGVSLLQFLLKIEGHEIYFLSPPRETVPNCKRRSSSGPHSSLPKSN